jgi:hypothetical protein
MKAKCLRCLGLWAGVILVAGLVACAATLPQVTLQDADTTGIALADLKEGRRRYVNKCGGCHPLYAPSAYPGAVWNEQVEEMRGRAHLTDEDKRLILTYLQGMSPSK